MIETSCPEARRVSTRRNNLNKTWQSKAWREARAGFIVSHGGKCEWCGSTEHLTVHHPMRNSYGPQVYLNFALSECILLCRSCHAALHAGRVLCEREHADGEKHYRWHDAEMCNYCYLSLHPEVTEQKKEAKKAAAKKRRELDKAKRERAKKWKIDHPLPKKNGKNGGKA